MKQYKLILFDLDGTLADTSEGILMCHRAANAAMGKPITDEAILDGIIGGPLLKTYRERFGYNQEDAIKAVSLYRDYYSEMGFTGSRLYPGIVDCLRVLREHGYLLAVATLKEETLGKQILKLLGIDAYFDLIHGMDNKDTLKKKDILCICMDALRSDPEETVLVGDSIYDEEGAKQAGIDFIGVTYGFGFTKGVIPNQIGAVAVADSCVYLRNYFLSEEEDSVC